MSLHNPIIDAILSGDIGGRPTGFNPAIPDPTNPDLLKKIKKKGGKISGVLSQVDDFLNNPSGAFLLNLLAQQGYSTIPQSRLGAVGRAGVATLQQQQKKQLIEAQINKLGAPAKPASRGTPILVKDPKTGKSTFLYPNEAVGLEPGVRPSSAAETLKVIIDPETGKPTYVSSADALGEEAPTGFKPEIEFTEDALDIAAATYRLTGKVPSGLTRQPGVVAKILDRARTQAEEQGLSSDQVLDVQQEFKANQTALAALERQRTLVSAFEKTAIKNMDLAVSLGKKVGRTGSPIVNAGLIAFKKDILGDKDTAAFVNAIIASRTEYAKVLSGAIGAAGITDSARHEAKELFDTAFNQETLEHVVEVARQEMKNRIDSFAEQKREFTIGTRKVDFGRPETIDDSFDVSAFTQEQLEEIANSQPGN